jgi:methionine aminotransferase
MALEYNAINLSQGFPDFSGPDELLALVNHYITVWKNQYAPMPGIHELRFEISKKIENLYNRKYDPDTDIIITAGATQAIYTAVTCCIQPGDEVILFEPAYDSYAPSVIINGGIPVFVPMGVNSFFDFNALQNAVSRKTKLIILNSPHNPTGRVINSADLLFLEDITRDKDIYLLSDEVYEHIVFDGKLHVSISQSQKLSERSFVISSFGKTYHSTGWKTGYCAAPKKLADEFKKVHQYMVFSVNSPVQYAFAEYIKNTGHYLSLGNFYQKKRDLFLKNIINSRFRFIPSQGTYFQLLDYSGISDSDDIAFSEFLTKEAGVAVIPLSPFYSSSGYNGRIIRICFAKKEEVIIEACKRLSKV